MSRTFIYIPKNVSVGVTINRKQDLWRLKELKSVETEGKLLVSFEPLYEDVGNIDFEGIEWVIIGAQTRPNVQPESKWVEDLINEARRVGAAVFLKNNLSDEIIHDVADDMCQEFPKP